jgi:hypothetical protein
MKSNNALAALQEIGNDITTCRNKKATQLSPGRSSNLRLLYHLPF